MINDANLYGGISTRGGRSRITRCEWRIGIRHSLGVEWAERESAAQAKRSDGRIGILVDKKAEHFETRFGLNKLDRST